MPGIYATWEKCQEQVNGFEGARFKSFESRAEAEKALNLSPAGPEWKKEGPARKKEMQPNAKGRSGTFNPYSICVDAACSGNPGVMEYRCVETVSKKEIFHSAI